MKKNEEEFGDNLDTIEEDGEEYVKVEDVHELMNKLYADEVDQHGNKVRKVTEHAWERLENILYMMVNGDYE